MKILNLYAGIGGNRKLWGNEHKVIAVELDPEIAEIYKKNFPNDEVIVGDAHEYLLKHFEEFDFIWSSPPCQTHSRLNLTLISQERTKQYIRYPDMKLYQEILFLQQFFKKGKWVVENVIPYYKPLLKPWKADCHYFWSNFPIGEFKGKGKRMEDVYNSEVSKWGFSLKEEKIKKRKDQVLNNLVNPELGLHIFNMAFKEKQKILDFTQQNTSSPRVNND